MKDTLRETYKASNHGLYRLAAAGTRMAFDMLITDLLKSDAGYFNQKLDALLEAGYISKYQKTQLDATIDVSSAAQHRGHTASEKDVLLIIAILEGLIYQTMLANDEITALRLRTPQRASAKRAGKKAT